MTGPMLVHALLLSLGSDKVGTCAADDSSCSSMPEGTLQLLYGTVVYSVELPGMEEDNQKIVTMVEDAWQKMMTNLSVTNPKLVADPNQREVLNEKFHDWHRKHLFDFFAYADCLSLTHQSVEKCEAESVKNSVWPEYVTSPTFVKLFRWNTGLIWRHMRRYLSLLGYREAELEEMFHPRQPVTYETWATRHANGVSHSEHGHTGSLFSGVYYVRTPGAKANEGQLSFKDPKVMALIEDDDQTRGASYDISPTAGTLVLWPSYIRHQVKKTSSEDPRISIPVDMNFPIGIRRIAVQTIGKAKVPGDVVQGGVPFQFDLESTWLGPDDLEPNIGGLGRGNNEMVEEDDEKRKAKYLQFLKLLRKKFKVFKNAKDEDAKEIFKFALKYRMLK